MKRVYAQVSVVSDDAGWQVRLDARPLRTPGKHLLILPTEALARAIADEWTAQGETIVAATMPLTKLANSTAEAISGNRGRVIADLAKYAATELLCYRAREPADLVERQDRLWQPWLDWTRDHLGADLVVTRDVMPAEQPEAATAALRKTVEEVPDWPLVGLHAATTALGSLILALALRDNRVTPDLAFDLAHLDELFEMERWGVDAEAAKRHEALRRDIRAAHRFMQLAAV